MLLCSAQFHLHFPLLLAGDEFLAGGPYLSHRQQLSSKHTKRDAKRLYVHLDTGTYTHGLSQLLDIVKSCRMVWFVRLRAIYPKGIGLK